jgi:uncharacterized protein (DUF927 family)
MVDQKNRSPSLSDTTKVGPVALITVAGEGFDEGGERYFKLEVKGSKRSLPPYSMKRIIDDPNTLYTDLSNAGAHVFTTETKRQLLKMLEERETQPPSFKVASFPGWHGSRLVFPDRSFGSSKLPVETSFGDLDEQMMAKYRSWGTLKKWQEQIFALCTRNSRLIFALSLAAAPLI